MKKQSLDRAMLLFERFKSHKITSDELHVAEGKANNLKDKMDDFKLLIAMCKDTFSGKYSMSKWNLSVIIGTIIYVISPIDAIPDVIPVLGWIDDIAIVSYAISKLAEEIKNYQLFKATENSEKKIS